MELGKNAVNETEISQRRQPVVLIQQLDYDIKALVAREIDGNARVRIGSVIYRTKTD